MPLRHLAHWVALSLAVPPALQAQSAAVAPDSGRTRVLAGVRVTGRLDDLTGVATSASEGRVGAAELRIRPLQREGELLETVPGMIVTQHSGEGKANQLFVRGFNLDHGTDFQTRLDGMPLNMPSHAHGQGYTDLNFLIPELVGHLDYKLGVHHASIGDFGSAGGAELHLVNAMRPFAAVETGQFGLARLATGGSGALAIGTLLGALELKGYDGPWVRPEALRKFSGLARFSAAAGASHWSVTAMAYTNRWNASDQIPQRLVVSGQVGAFGQVDSTLGGVAERYSLSGEWVRVTGTAVQSMQLHGVLSSLDLYSNFTYDLGDSTAGDQFNQREHRSTVGANLSHRQGITRWGVEHSVTVGLQHRSDFVRGLGLYRTRRRQRAGTVREDAVTESGTGIWAEAESRWRPWFRSVVGVRGDGTLFEVASDNVANSGSRRAAIASPKASLIFTPAEGTELYVSAGLGFHSNDARGTTIAVDPATGAAATPVSPLVRSRGGELGLRASPLPGWRLTAVAWTLALDSELLFVGDGGTTEPSAASERSGVTIANFYRPTARLSLDFDVSVTRARFRGVAPDAQRIPAALESVVAAGIALGGGRGPFAALRVRHFGAYPLVESNAVRATPSTLLNGDAGFQFTRLRVQVSVLNLLNSDARDIQYFYSSRVGGEPVAGVGDVHFHPAEPRQVRLSVRWER